MVGLQATVFKMQLGPLLNGIVNYETWASRTADHGERLALSTSMKTYQAKAGAEGVDPLGYYLGTWGYALSRGPRRRRSKATKSLDDTKIADYIRMPTPFKTVHG